MGDYHIERAGAIVGNFKRFQKKRYQDPTLWAWLDFFSTLKRYQFSNSTSYVNGTAEALTVAISMLNTLRGTKTAFLTSKSYD